MSAVRDPQGGQPEPPEPLMQDRPAIRDCDSCGLPFRPTSPEHAAETVCTWCIVHTGASS